MAYKITQTKSFKKWLEGQKNLRVKIKIDQRIDRIEYGNFGDYKSVGDGISELRIGAYRVYYTLRGNIEVILLVGGDKGTQQADIKKAKTMLRNLE